MPAGMLPAGLTLEEPLLNPTNLLPLIWITVTIKVKVIRKRR
jgi:hypothetical protein